MELFYNLKKNGFLILLKSTILAVFFVLIYLFLLFAVNMNIELNSNLNEASNKELFTLTDTLTEPDAFYNFRQSKKLLTTVKSFYEKLNTNENINFVSSFDQPLQIENFKGKMEFNEAYGTDMEVIGNYIDPMTKKEVFDAKCFQVSKNFFDYYKLETDNNALFPWDDINIENHTLPILLGSNYKNSYSLGETIKGSFYLKSFDFKIIGFLKENTSVFYKNDLNKYLDDYIIVPYPEKLSNVSNENQEFVGMLYFAMLNGDVIIEQNKGLDYLSKQLSNAAKETGFYDYTLLGVPTFTLQYSRMYELINYNKTLLISIFLCITICLLAIVSFLNYKLYLNRRSRYYLSYFNGDSIKQLNTLIITDLSIGNALLLIFFVLFYLLFPIQNNLFLLNTVLGILLFSLLDIALMKRFLNKDIHSSFNDFY
ncbi:hypothetical protein A5821_003372 [Enterococcus sp. 7F3_DIV0205]|uniref:MacB-like periplasmic core domain-containing protein n=1 Tax=Candidatus Enterococcus palustris TaxID=1834189 RepID=A0AAQ3Y869_9ENTE|nr:hypothetical protein [Enterococcus sp. 7F3_DIV0205]OTN84254.1 hypothetical protein A5821_000180 [Enterococcus sp. 7F3_DIV0205]